MKQSNSYVVLPLIVKFFDSNFIFSLNNVQKHLLGASVWKSLVISLKAVGDDLRWPVDALSRCLLVDTPHSNIFLRPLVGFDVACLVDKTFKNVYWKARGLGNLEDMQSARATRDVLVKRWRGGSHTVTVQMKKGGKGTRGKNIERIATLFECVAKDPSPETSLPTRVLRATTYLWGRQQNYKGEYQNGFLLWPSNGLIKKDAKAMKIPNSRCPFTALDYAWRAKRGKKREKEQSVESTDDTADDSEEMEVAKFKAKRKKPNEKMVQFERFAETVDKSGKKGLQMLCSPSEDRTTARHNTKSTLDFSMFGGEDDENEEEEEKTVELPATKGEEDDDMDEVLANNELSVTTPERTVHNSRASSPLTQFDMHDESETFVGDGVNFGAVENVDENDDEDEGNRSDNSWKWGADEDEDDQVATTSDQNEMEEASSNSARKRSHPSANTVDKNVNKELGDYNGEGDEQQFRLTEPPLAKRRKTNKQKKEESIVIDLDDGNSDSSQSSEVFTAFGSQIDS